MSKSNIDFLSTGNLAMYSLEELARSASPSVSRNLTSMRGLRVSTARR